MVRVRAFIEANLHSNICVGDLSAVARRSSAYFSRSFKQAFGEPPHVYLMKRRLERACHLMVTTPGSLSYNRSPAPALLISTAQRHTGVLVAVRDSGPGMDPAHLERAFDAFYTTKAHGVGMGLSICRFIIDAHGGRLWAEANEPRGAIFQFTLPAVQVGP